MERVDRLGSWIPIGFRRALPFIAVVFLAEASAALPPGPVVPSCYIASWLVLTAACASMLLPWRSLPPWAIFGPTAAYLASLGLVLVALGATSRGPNAASGLTPLVLLPVLGIALHYPRRYSLATVAAALAMVVAVGVASDNTATSLVRRVFVYAVVGVIASLSVAALRAGLERRIAERDELARVNGLLGDATRELTSILDPEDVVTRGVRLMAEIASPTSEGLRRSSYLQIIDGVVHRHAVFDEVNATPVEDLLVDNPYLVEVVATGKPLTAAVDRATIGPSFREVVETTGMTHAAWIPVRPGGDLHGVITVASRGLAFTNDAFACCVSLGSIVELALSNALAHQRLSLEATTDPLTGLVNRRGFANAMAERPGRRPFALLVMDVDGLKQVNDTYGHDAGDEVIVAMANAVAGALRAGDVLARTGGDEFTALIVDADADDARKVALRIEKETAPIWVRSLHPTLSTGIACGTSWDDPVQVNRHADRAMYEAKAARDGLPRIYAEPSPLFTGAPRPPVG
ncbi:MAG TPA: GGDEF domain-containing protein [Acidimicrobiales bacterium]|nr:GGDEF domain-containing protein [Acidimicrobiales bacterium]